jgi:Flp pilus assembly protein TadG
MAANQRTRWRGGRGDAGAILVWSVFLLFVVGAFLALSMNVGHLYTARGELQNAADSAALAGAAHLDGTQAGVNDARTTSLTFSALHHTDAARAVDITAADVIPGHWSPITRQFTTPAASLLETNAVRVNVGREQARGNPLPVWFGRAFLRSEPLNSSSPALTQMDVRASAIAVGGGPCFDQCALPVVFAECQLVRQDGSFSCGQIHRFANDTQDNFGFTEFDSNASAAGVRAILQNGCTRGVPGLIGVNNGNFLNAVVDAFRAFLANNITEVTAPVARGGNLTCPNPRFNQDVEVSGFARFRICHVSAANEACPPAVDCATGALVARGTPVWCPDGTPGAAIAPLPAQWNRAGAGDSGFDCLPQGPIQCDRNVIYMSSQCDVVQVNPQPAGCGFYGLESPRPQLVR